MLRTLFILIDKEFRQIFRNPFIPKLIVLLPCLVILIIPLVATLDVRHVGVAIVDADRSTLSSRIVSDISASEYFTLKDVPKNYDEAFHRLEQGEVDVIVEIPEGFERSIPLRVPEKINVSANAVNSTKGGIGMQYVVQTIAGTLSSYTSEQALQQASDLFALQNRYNPTLNYRFFMIPALMTMIVILLCGFIPALNIVLEKENGTIEQINVTPVGRLTFTLGKLIPFWLIGLFVLSLAMLIAHLVYGLVPVGSIGLIYLATLLLIFTISGFAVAIANGSSTMQQTMFVMFFFVILFILMSGLLTPIESMPDWAQKLTYCFPPRYFIEIMRSVYLKGTLFIELWTNFAALAAFALLFNLFAALTYRKRR